MCIYQGKGKDTKKLVLQKNTQKYQMIQKKIRYGLSIAEKYWVGSGIGYPPDKGWPLVMHQMFQPNLT